MDRFTRSPVAEDVSRRARPLRGAGDLDPLLDAAREKHFVAIGEASHGTHEFYEWRAVVSRRLIEELGFTWIGVEGDWPDCWRVNRWVRGFDDQHLDARAVLESFERWPTWLWANEETAEFLDWLRAVNLTRELPDRVGFYGLDVYSLWDSLARIFAWLGRYSPGDMPAALRAWQCFAPFTGDPEGYAWNTRLVPTSCEPDVVALLAAVRRSIGTGAFDAAFDARQNAEVAVGAERYYRAMVRTDRGSWNIRDIHMTDTIDRITQHLGPESKGIVWEHNTHVGDARATSMRGEGLVNVGQLLRERHHADGVLLVGAAGHRGTVVAAEAWGSTNHEFAVPDARPGTHEDVLHGALGDRALVIFDGDRATPWLRERRGHRAIGVVYDPDRESGNYVPTVMGERYDALLWFEETTALHPLRPEPTPAEPEYETEPSGY